LAVHRTAPVLASNAYTAPRREPTNTDPDAAVGVEAWKPSPLPGP
jgi:hypothetical protein